MMLHRPTEKHMLIDEVDLVAVEAKGDENVELDEAFDAVIDSSHIPTGPDSSRHYVQLSEEIIEFKVDLIQARVADVGCVLDPDVLYNLLDNQLALSKFSGAFMSTFANPQDTDFEIFHSREDSIDFFASITHAENPKGVSADLLSNISQIYSETVKQTPKKKTHPNRQDENSNLSRNFGTNDWMLR